MALPQVGQPFVPATQEQIRDAILADYRLEMLKTTGQDPSVAPGTEPWIWATAHAAIAMLQFSNIELSRDAITPINATGQDLENWRIALGLPEVQPSPSSGRIRVSIPSGVTGTLTDGQPVQLPNGLRAKVVGNWIGISDGSEVDVITIDTGSRTEFDGGTSVTLVGAPTVFDSTALVSVNVPLRGGRDKEDDNRKRTRILNAIANKPAAGNWAHIREIALEASPFVLDCYVFPALGGPASVKVVPVRDFDIRRGEFTRAMSSAALGIVRAALYNQLPDGVEVVTEAAADFPFDAALLVSIPPSALAGGSGSGWVDQPILPDTVPWPQLASGELIVWVSAVTSSTQITISAQTSTTPIAGQTHIMWWSSIDRKFRQFLVIGVAGGAGAWQLTLDRPLVSDDGSTVTASLSELISPAAVNADGYRDSWLNAMRALGPGEATADAARLPRSLRHPYVSDAAPSTLSFLTLKAFQENHDEISDLAWSFRTLVSAAFLVPATVADPVNILVPRGFAIYAQQ